MFQMFSSLWSAYIAQIPRLLQQIQPKYPPLLSEPQAAITH